MNKVNLTGRKFDMLTVLHEGSGRTTKGGQRKVTWICQCECGNITEVDAQGLKRKGRISCGCMKKKFIGDATRSHGEAHTRLYSVWWGMIQRCKNKSTKKYESYGARGISVCEEWHDYPTFAKWARENGYDGNADFGECTIDRIDFNGNYCPQNCRWTDAKTQANNTRANRIIECDGVSHTLSEWADITDIHRKTISERLKMGWNTHDAIYTPVRGC